MRNAGATYEKIAEQMGYSVGSAQKDVFRAIRETVRVPTEAMLDRQRAIINDLIRVNYQTAIDRNHPRQFEAQAKLLECLKHEAQLWSLYAPAKVQVGITAGEFAQQAVDLLKATGSGPLVELVRAAPEVLDVEPEEPGSWSNLGELSGS